MARFVTGNEFNTGDQVTAANLNNAVNNAKISTDSVDGTSIDIDTSGGIAKLRVKDSTGAADGVTLAKIAHQPANTVLVRDANSQGAISAKAVADTEILIGDGDGFTSTSLSGAVTMTNAGVTSITASASLPDGVTATSQASTDDSTKVATTEFVQDAITENALKVATFGKSSGSTASDTTIPITEQADPNNIATVSSGVVSIGVGTYLIRFFGHYEMNQGNFDIDYKINGSIVADYSIAGNTGKNSFIFDYIHSVSSGTDTLQIDLDETTEFSSINYDHVGITVMKLS